jgi:regulator of sirC expression with transglutaminase-like and TPR domain
VRHEIGFRGSDDYDDPRSNYLNDVIERRTGSPVAMAVVLMALGRRAGVDVQGVAFPGHFLVRVEGHYADPFEGGAPLERERLLSLARESLDNPEDAASCLEPVGPRAIGVRLLLNLQRIHALRGDHARSLVVCDRLFELTRAPIHRVERGTHALALGASRAAISDLEAYLVAEPEGDGAKRAREALARAKLLAAPPLN